MKDLETIILPVLEMSCAVCANNVENTVKGLPGVEEASVNFAANTLSVKYHPSLITGLGDYDRVRAVVLRERRAPCVAR